MKLIPPTYTCLEHQMDVTDLVREELEERIPIAYKPQRPGPFEVVVTCPGAGSPHDLECNGQVSYEEN
jgi:hypothetical protein